jgi:deoxycytidine triphosphate deaminase
MILISKEISDLKIVDNPIKESQRETTYDATVGEIIHEGKTFARDAYVLPSRGMVWVVSRERFALPPHVTGLATLRTTWTHSGILALNVGIIDPGWHGPLATALVNFSSTNFEIKKGEAFLRVLFISHSETQAKEKNISTNEYLRQMRDRSARIPNTFLNISSLAEEVKAKIFDSSAFGSWIARWGVWLAAIAIGLTLIPIAYGVSTEWMGRRVDLEILKASVDDLRKQQSAQRVDQIQIRTLEDSIDRIQKEQQNLAARERSLEERLAK